MIGSICPLWSREGSHLLLSFSLCHIRRSLILIQCCGSKTSVTRSEPEVLRDSHGTGIGNAADNLVDYPYLPQVKSANRFGGRFCEGLWRRTYACTYGDSPEILTLQTLHDQWP